MINYDRKDLDAFKRVEVKNVLNNIPEIKLYQIVYVVDDTQLDKWTCWILGSSRENCIKYIYSVHRIDKKKGKIKNIESVNEVIPNRLPVSGITDETIIKLVNLNKDWVSKYESELENAREKEVVENKGRLRNFNSKIEEVKNTLKI